MDGINGKMVTSGPGRLPSPTQKCASGACSKHTFMSSKSSNCSKHLFMSSNNSVFKVTCPLYVKLGMRKVCASTTTTLVMRAFHTQSSFHHRVIQRVPVIIWYCCGTSLASKKVTHLSEETSWMPSKARIFWGLGYRSWRGIRTSPKLTPNASHQTDNQRIVRRVFPPGRVSTMSSFL